MGNAYQADGKLVIGKVEEVLIGPAWLLYLGLSDWMSSPMI